MAHGPKTRSRDLAACALAAGKPLAEAATSAGVGLRTVAEWTRQPDFKARVQEIQGEAIGRAVGILADGLTEAAQVLRELLRSEKDAIRLRAADSLIRNGLNLIEIRDLQERLERLESAAKGKPE